ncbi:hypothetical protein Landi51_10246 [Colletotrichum acutatum]
MPSSAALPIGFYSPLSIRTLINTINYSRRSCHTTLGLFSHLHWAAMHLDPRALQASEQYSLPPVVSVMADRLPAALLSIWLLRKRHDSRWQLSPPGFSALLNSNHSLAKASDPALNQSV